MPVGRIRPRPRHELVEAGRTRTAVGHPPVVARFAMGDVVRLIAILMEMPRRSSNEAPGDAGLAVMPPAAGRTPGVAGAQMVGAVVTQMACLGPRSGKDAAHD